MQSKQRDERRESEPSLRSAIAHALINLSGTPANNAFKWVSIMLMVIFSAQPFSNAVVALAGKTTVADMHVSASADIKVDTNGKTNPSQKDGLRSASCLLIATSGITIGIGGLFVAYRQRKLRQDVIQKSSERIRHLEHMIDPNRSTSGLTVRGETNPEDQ